MAAFAFASCSQDEVVTQSPQVNKAIEFGTYVGRDAVSRGSVITQSGSTANATDGTIATDALTKKGFGVFAYYTDNKDFVPADIAADGNTPAKEASPCNFMYNQSVNDLNGTGWTYDPLKYWPNEGTDKLSFFAYAPYDAGTSSNFTFNTNPGLPTLNFTVNETVKEQQDLLWAAPHLNLTKDATNADIDDAVKFEFKHALARIGFDVQTMIDKVNGDTDGTTDDETTTGTTIPNNGTDLDGKTTVVVKKVELSGKFITSGTLAWTEGTGSNAGKYTAAITNSTTPTSSTTYTLSAEMGTGENPTLATNFKASIQTYSLGAKDPKLTVYGQSVNGTEAQLNADDSYIMIIPKEFKDNDNLTIKVTYDVITVDGNLAKGYSCVTNVINTSFTGINFEAGKAYKFSLHLGLTSVKLSATVDNWVPSGQSETDYAVNVPLNITDNDTSNP